MRVVMPLACYCPWIGGAEVFAQRLAEDLVSKRYEVEVVTGWWSGKRGVEKEEVIGGVRVSRVRPVVNWRFVKTLSWTWPGYQKSLEVISAKREAQSTKHKIGIDDLSSRALSLLGFGWGGKAQAAGVVHAHIFPGMAVGAMVKRKVGWPLLTTVQGGDLGDYPETTGAGKGILRPLIKWSLKQADVVHAVSEYLAGKAKRLGAKKVVVVPNGVDVKMFRLGDRLGLRKKYDFLMDDKIVVSHSRLTPKNGMDVLIRAFALVRQKGAVRNLKLLIIGEGYQRKELEILIGKLGLGGAVVLMGEKPHEEIPGYLRLADVFCRPARDEGFGISFIEAMACGLPVVGTRVGGIPEIVEEGKTGWLVERGDVRGVAEAMVKLVTDKGLRVKWGREGRRVVERKFAWGRVMGEMEKVYREVGSQAVEV